MDSRHISFTATSAYLKISETPQDNLVFHNAPSAYTFAPIGFAGVLTLDLIMLPVTFIHDLVQTLRGVPPGRAEVGTYAHRYRGSIRTLIAVH